MTGVTSVAIGATMPTTATASARGEAAAAADPALVHDLAPDPGPVVAAIILAHAAAATATAAAVDHHPTPDAGAGLALRLVLNPGLQ